LCEIESYPRGALDEVADVAVLVAPPADLRTPLVESFQAVVWHALVSHPAFALRQGHWETIAYRAGPHSLTATGSSTSSFSIRSRGFPSRRSTLTTSR
jgi:hypothetical protein